MKAAYLVEKDEQLIFTGIYMEAYIPDALFEKGISEYDGDKINTLGLFNFRVFDKIDQDASKVELKTYNFPSQMTMKPNAVDVKEIELIPGTGIQKYHILKFFNNDIVMTSIFVVSAVDNTEKFIKLLNEGNLPNTIPYDEVLNLFLKNLEINGINLNVSATLLSTVISEIYRYKGDMSKPFRLVIGKNPKESQYNYVSANARTICSFNSTFSALTFEDIDSMIITSINKNRYERKETYTPIEAIVKV